MAKRGQKRREDHLVRGVERSVIHDPRSAILDPRDYIRAARPETDIQDRPDTRQLGFAPFTMFAVRQSPISPLLCAIRTTLLCFTLRSPIPTYTSLFTYPGWIPAPWWCRFLIYFTRSLDPLRSTLSDSTLYYSITETVREKWKYVRFLLSPRRD